MTVQSDIREKAKSGIDRASDLTVKMILAMLEVQEHENESEREFEDEIERRVRDYEQGKIKAISRYDLEASLRKSLSEIRD